MGGLLKLLLVCTIGYYTYNTHIKNSDFFKSGNAATVSKDCSKDRDLYNTRGCMQKTFDQDHYYIINEKIYKDEVSPYFDHIVRSDAGGGNYSFTTSDGTQISYTLQLTGGAYCPIKNKRLYGRNVIPHKQIILSRD